MLMNTLPGFHTVAKNAFDIALQYIKQNSTLTPMYILWIKK